jgi:DNA-directed RNA polymerase subunit A'
MSESFLKYPLGKIDALKFEVLNSDEIRRKSTVQVEDPRTYDDKGILVEKGVLDPRMGVNTANQRCLTCGADFLHCMGHIGSIELPVPLFHPEFIEVTMLAYSLICDYCNAILVYKKGVCKVCNEIQPKYKLAKPTIIYKNGIPVTAEEVAEKFNSANLNELRFAHPSLKNYNPSSGLINVLVVGAVTMRPSLILDSGKKSEDDTTHKYLEILRTVVKYKRANPETLLQSTKIHFINLLQYHLTTLINNSCVGIPAAQHRSGKVMIGLVDRLKGKKGRFRKHLAGKRINFAARSVITPSIQRKIGEVGVPKIFAKQLTKPYYINRINKEMVLKIFDEDKECEKITHVLVGERKLKVLPTNKETIREMLVEGVKVYRTLMDGDTVLLNRNPTLQQQSMLAHTVYITDGSSIVLHPSVCIGYNADFDGDEMALHVPQTEEADIEAKELLSVEKNITVLKTGNPILGVQKDIIAGLYCLTKYDYDYEPYIARALLEGVDIEIPTFKTITGPQLFSLLLPNTLNVNLMASNVELKIENGQLTKGYITSKFLGSEGILLVQIYAKYSHEVYIKFVENLAILGTNVAEYFGVTYGVNDIYGLPIIEVPEDMDNIEQTLKGLETTFINKVANMEGRPSCAWIIADSQASGNKLSLVLNSLFFGLQHEDQYMKFSSMSFRRHRLLVKNFIKNSLLIGLDSLQYFLAAITGRISLIDLFVKTSSVGYMNRKMSNSLEDLVVHRDQTVRNSEGQILYLKYANDGLDRTKINELCPWVDLSKYFPMNDNRVVTDMEIEDGYESIKHFHIGQEYPKLFLKGCIHYMYANNHDLKELLKWPNIDEIYTHYLLPEGTPAGLMTAQCLAEPTTQVNLNKKHSIGDSTLASALEGLFECLTGTKTLKVPFIKIIADTKYKTKLEDLANELRSVKLPEVAKIELDLTTVEYKLIFDTEKLKQYNLTIPNIIVKLVKYSEEIRQEENSLFVKVAESFNVLSTFYDTLNKLNIKGLKNAQCEVYIKGNKTELFIYNADLKHIYTTLNAIEYPCEIRCNQFHRILEFYGILSVKHYLYKEIYEIFQSQGLSLSLTHIKFVVDTMTMTGKILGLSRSGVIAKKGSTLARASFETANRVLINAAIAQKIDYLQGQFENTLLGKQIQAGTAKIRIYEKYN